MSSAVGGSEASLRALFARAAAFAYGSGSGPVPGAHSAGATTAPRPRLALIFLDEVDVLCRSRDGAVARSSVQSRVIAQLGTLLDGVQATAAACPADPLHAPGHLVIVAATNHPHNVDAALRRPGRLDREVRAWLHGLTAQT
jgi:SpoVK/Ycf46/Vps4 family AAA+-type ATPase